MANGGSPFVMVVCITRQPRYSYKCCTDFCICNSIMCFTKLCFPRKAFALLMMLVVAAIVINWVVISWTHLKFRKMMPAQRVTSKFPSIAYPFSNYLCIVFMLGILVVMSLTLDMRIAVMMIPAWILCLMFAYFLKQRKL